MWDTRTSAICICPFKDLICDGSESAATLEAESGYSMEAPEVSDFRHYILDGSWGKAEAALTHLVVSDDEGLWVWHKPLPDTQTPRSPTCLTGCKVPNQSAEIFGVAGSEEDDGCIARFAQRACATER